MCIKPIKPLAKVLEIGESVPVQLRLALSGGPSVKELLDRGFLTHYKIAIHDSRD
jgi:hypothetical protein